MLGSKLASLDIPSDGSVRLVGVQTSIDPVDGAQIWTVVFKEKKGGAGVTPPHVNDNEPSTPKTPGAPQENALYNPPTMTVTDPLQNLRMDRLFPLKCMVMNYAWGKLGADSLVGRLASTGLDEMEINPGTPYGELWVGTHPSGPSMVMLTSPWRTVTPLSEWIKLNPSLLGPRRPSASSPMVARRHSMRMMRAHSLPFLFKILSVRTALSIQAHPDKALAAKLHVRHPDQYKDDNHKPEMAVAITPFEALCSFQPVYSVLSNCRATPELVALVGEKLVAALDDAAAHRARLLNERDSPQGRRSPTGRLRAHDGAMGIPRSSSLDGQIGGGQIGGGGGGGGGVGETVSSIKERRASKEGKPEGAEAEAYARVKACFRALFEALMTAPADRIAAQLAALVRRVQSTNEMLRAPVEELAMRLHAQYPGDVGVFCVYLLNYKLLKPGEALFLGANEPHAYLSGDCAEVMATSDNVVRAGLTPKWKDVETLCSCLTYIDGPPHLVVPTQPAGQPHVWTYVPPEVVDEFLLDRVEFGAQDGAVDGEERAAEVEARLPASAGLAVLIVVHGTATVEQLDSQSDEFVGLKSAMSAGAIHLVCPHTVLRLRPCGREPLLVFRAAAKPQPGSEEAAELTGITSISIAREQRRSREAHA